MKNAGPSELIFGPTETCRSQDVAEQMCKQGSGSLGGREREGERLAVVGFWKFKRGGIPWAIRQTGPTAFLRTLSKNRALAGRAHRVIL